MFDAVDLYAALEPYSAMKPVVVQPNIRFAQLSQELAAAPTAEARLEIQEQFVAKLQRKRRVLLDANAEQFTALAGMEPEKFVREARTWTPEQTRDWLAIHPQFVQFLDRVGSLDPRRILISEHADEVLRVERGYGSAKKPGAGAEGDAEDPGQPPVDGPAAEVAGTDRQTTGDRDDRGP